MIPPRAVEAIESSDTDELLRVVDDFCKSRSWGDLELLRSRCHEALQRGKQLWGVEEHIRYRLALEAPAEVAGRVVSEGSSRFGLGPLPEVAASSHSWVELSGHLEHGPTRATTAAERVVRGETVDNERLELPGQLLDWEPRYVTATYKRDRVEAHAPDLPSLQEVALPGEVQSIGDPISESGLSDLVAPWVEESNGRCETSTVEGDHLSAIRGLGLTTARAGALSPLEALSWMGWAAASGGAHGRRRGAAAGRYLAWWAVAGLADLDWPPDPAAVGAATRAIGWHWFDDGSPDIGWSIRLAISDPKQGISWAIAAVDVD